MHRQLRSDANQEDGEEVINEVPKPKRAKERTLQHGADERSESYRELGEDREWSIAEGGQSVDREFYRRFAVDRKIVLNSSCADFRFHLEEPKRGTLTGSELPILPLYSWRSISGTIMDRYLAAGPSKDPVIHRGFKLTREHVAPFPPNCPIPVSVILAMPIVHHMPSNQRELLEQIQNLCRVHYGDGNDVEALENCLQNFVELLIDSETDDMRSALMVSIMRKRKPPQREMAKLLAYVGKRIDVEKEQMLSIIQILRNRDCLNRDQSERLRENFFDVFRERNNGRIRLIDIQRAVIKAKYRMPEE